MEKSWDFGQMLTGYGCRYERVFISLIVFNHKRNRPAKFSNWVCIAVLRTKNLITRYAILKELVFQVAEPNFRLTSTMRWWVWSSAHCTTPIASFVSRDSRPARHWSKPRPRMSTQSSGLFLPKILPKDWLIIGVK